MTRRFRSLLLGATALIATCCPAGPSSAQNTGPVPDGRSMRLTKVTVEVPRHRVADSAFWDEALGGLLLGNTRELLPDVKICLRAAGQAMTCLPVCKDSPECVQSVNLAMREPIELFVFDEDAFNRDELILAATISDAASCTPCRFSATGGAANVYLEGSSVAAAPAAVASGCPSALRDRYLACQAEAAEARDPTLCATAVQEQQRAAGIVRDWEAQDRLATMHPASRLQLLEMLVAAPPTPEATAARDAIYASAPELNIDLDFWPDFSAEIVRIAFPLHFPTRRVWAIMSGDQRRAAVERLIGEVLAPLDTTVTAIHWRQSWGQGLNPLVRLAWILQPSGRYDRVANEIVLSEGLLARVLRDDLLDGALEESIHAWQTLSSHRYWNGEIDADGPLCRQARLFVANWLGYAVAETADFAPAYNGQPLEVFAKEAAQIIRTHVVQ
jgi:hypothetical protein